MALYAIGLSEYELVKINLSTYMTSDDKIHTEITLIEFDIPNHQVSFYNNLEDVVKILNKIKRNKNNIKFKSALSFLYNKAVDVSQLQIYRFEPTLVSENEYK